MTPPTGRPQGRPTKLTAAVQQTIVDAIANGAYKETAAQLAGVHRATLYNWLARGETDTPEPVNPNDHSKADLQAMCDDAGLTYRKADTKATLANLLTDRPSPYADFLDAVKEAEAKGEAYALGMAMRTGQDDWRFWITYLERTRPDRWGRRPASEEVEDGYIGDESDAQRIIDRSHAVRDAIRIAGTSPGQLPREANG